LGADVKGSVYLEPDGAFPNHVPNPEAPGVMSSFANIVKKAGADLGIIFDTDVDRAALVGKGGQAIGKSKLIALISDIVLRENPGSIIVTDSVTSTSLKPFIESRGGVHHRFMRGYANVIAEAQRLDRQTGNCALAIETSGHCALKENGFLDDGAYLVVKILIFYAALLRGGHELSDVLSDYRDAAEESELRIEITSKDYRFMGMQILSEFEKYAQTVDGWSVEEPNYEGVRVNSQEPGAAGRLLLRMSLHEPQLAVNIESDDVGGAGRIAQRIYTFLRKYKKEIKADF